jgi:exodeoxyribonuclease VII large subunit
MTDLTPKPAATARTNAPEFSVSELSQAIKRTLEGAYGYVRLRGEISGYRGPHGSGHCYFSLKDDKSKLEAVIWRGVFQALRFKPEEGMEVIATGKITTYPGSSKYQIVIDALEPAGAGALMALLEERKRKLTAEGLFAAERKRRLPFLPSVVGIITSPTGAVIRDMLHGFDERFPTHVVLWPVRVQGETSAAEVTAAIRGFNALPEGGAIPRPDVLIVARGGGSLEDLWGFNDEALVRAAAASAIPLISAVGHETDWTLIDLAADARAPTPTKAAEWAVPKFSDLVTKTADLDIRLKTGLVRVIDTARAHLKAAERGLPRLADLIALPRQRFDAVEQRLSRALSANTQAHAKRLARIAPRLQPRLVALRIERGHERVARLTQRADTALSRIAQGGRRRLERVSGRLAPQLLANRIGRQRDRLGGLSQMLASLSYHSVLKRGYALVRDADGTPVRSATAIDAGAAFTVQFADGDLAARAETPPADRTAAASARSAASAQRTKAAARPPNKGGQGQLF